MVSCPIRQRRILIGHSRTLWRPKNRSNARRIEQGSNGVGDENGICRCSVWMRCKGFFFRTCPTNGDLRFAHQNRFVLSSICSHTWSRTDMPRPCLRDSYLRPPTGVKWALRSLRISQVRAWRTSREVLVSQTVLHSLGVWKPLAFLSMFP